MRRAIAHCCYWMLCLEPRSLAQDLADLRTQLEAARKSKGRSGDSSAAQRQLTSERAKMQTKMSRLMKENE